MCGLMVTSCGVERGLAYLPSGWGRPLLLVLVLLLLELAGQFQVAEGRRGPALPLQGHRHQVVLTPATAPVSRPSPAPPLPARLTWSIWRRCSSAPPGGALWGGWHSRKSESQKLPSPSTLCRDSQTSPSSCRKPWSVTSRYR